MALPAQEPFTGTGALSGSWTVPTYSAAAPTRDTDVGRGNVTGNYSAAYWNADSFPNDQYAQCKYSTVAAYVYLMVRKTLDNAHTCYAVEANGTTNTTLYRVTAGSFVSLQNFGAVAWSAGDTMRLEVQGTTLRVYRNGGQLGTDSTDSNFTSGAAGFEFYDQTARIDDWEGGAIGAPGDPFVKVEFRGVV